MCAAAHLVVHTLLLDVTFVSGRLIYLLGYDVKSEILIIAA